MNLIWHMVWKDVRRLRWTILMFSILLALPMVIAVMSYPPDGLMAGVAAIAGSMLEYVVIPVVSYLLVMSVLGEDTLTKGNEFWRVRPISGMRLLGSKVVLCILLLLVLPFILSLPWWLAHGYGWEELGVLLKTKFLVRFFVIGLALAPAAISDTSGKYISYSFMFIMLVGGLAAFIANTRYDLYVVAPDVEATRGWLVTGILCLTALGVILNQFLTRQIVRSWGMIGMAMVVVIGTSLFWPWDFVSYFKDKREAEPMASLVVRVTSGKLSRFMPPNKFPLQVGYELSGLPEPYLVTLNAVTHDIIWPDRTITGDKKTNLIETALDANQQALDQLLKVGKSVPREPQMTSAYLALPDAVSMERLIHEPAVYRAKVSGKVWKPEIIAELPCQVGAASSRQGFGVEIQSFEVLRGVRIQVSLLQHTPEFVTADRPLFIDSRRRTDSENRLTYAIINRQRGGLLMVAPSQREHVSSAATVRRFEQQLVFSPRTSAEAPSGDLVEWLKEAVLVVCFLYEEGGFKRTVETPQLIVTGLPPKESGAASDSVSPAPTSTQ